MRFFRSRVYRKSEPLASACPSVTLAVSALDSYLAVAENGTSLLGWHIDLPAGTRVIVVGVLMALVLILRPSGLTGGREFRLWPRSRT